MINFSEKREKQRIASEKKEKFSAATKKEKLMIFSLWEKGAFKFKVKKSFRYCMSKKECFGTILPLQVSS